MRFQIAVVEFDAVMTGNSRPSTDRHRFPVNGWLILESGHSMIAIVDSPVPKIEDGKIHF